METKNTQDKKKTEPPVVSGLKGLSEFHFISKDFFLKHKGSILFFAAMMLFYINNRYMCLKKISEIESLKQELKDIRYEALTRSSDLIGISRPSQVKEMIRKQGIELEESDKPAYNLND